MSAQDSKPEDRQPPDDSSAEDETAAEQAEDAEAGSEADAESEDGEAIGAPTEARTPEEEIAALKDRLLRALADNENTIRRTRREREDTAKYAVANLARDVLTVADNLRRAIEAIPDELREGDGAANGLIDGVTLTERELLATLERHGIRKIEPLGEKFDHNLHQAMFEVPTAEAEPGTVVQVMQAGYVIHDRLLRAAQVGVAKALPDPGKDHQVDTTA